MKKGIIASSIISMVACALLMVAVVPQLASDRPPFPVGYAQAVTVDTGEEFTELS